MLMIHFASLNASKTTFESYKLLTNFFKQVNLYRAVAGKAGKLRLLILLRVIGCKFNCLNVILIRFYCVWLIHFFNFDTHIMDGGSRKQLSDF